MMNQSNTKKRLIILSLVVLVQSAVAQRTKPEHTPYSPAAVDMVSVSIIQQPGCPLKIVEAQALVLKETKKPTVQFRVQNTGEKAIRSFSVEFKLVNRNAFDPTASLGFEDGYGQPYGRGVNLLLPGEFFLNIKDLEIDRAGRSVAGPVATPGAGALWIGLVTQVVWDDGSVFSARAQSDRISQIIFPGT